MVVAKNAKEAVEIAKKNAPNEITNYGKGIALPINRINEIPDDWKSVIPYAAEGAQEIKKCYELIAADDKNGLEAEEIANIIRIQETKKNDVEIDNSIKPETRPDPIPPNLDWHDTKSGRPLPRVRFVR